MYVVGIILTTMSYIRKRKRNGKVYLEEVESIRVDGKVKQKHIRYVGKEANGKTVLSSSISNVEIESVKLYGPLVVLNHLCEELGLSELLGKYGNEILSLVFAHCHDYKSINEMSSWFNRTDLNILLNLNSLTEDRLLKALDSIENQDSMKLQQKIFERVKKIYKLNLTGVVYDVTNTYLYGNKCPLAKRGRDKTGGKGNPLIQVGLGVTQKEGIPVFHKTYDGNTPDSRTLRDLISSFEHYRIKSGIIIFDRGITSGSNIRLIKQLGWDTICGVKSDRKLKEETRSLLKRGKLIDIKHRVKLNNNVFYVFTKKYSLRKAEGHLLICYNEQQKKDLRESRYDEILAAQESLKAGKQIKEGLHHFFDKNKEVKKSAIAKAEEFDGFSFIFSTRALSTKQIVHLYLEDKDTVEKAFRTLKGVVKLRPIRHWLYNRVTAHVFICYLSYLLLSLLKIKLTPLAMSPVKALKELDSLYKVYITDSDKGFKLHRTVALNKTQQAILRAVDRKLARKCSG
jgi:transposase